MPGPYRATADGQSVGRGAPPPPRACGHMPFPVRLRRGAASPTPCGGCPANDACGKCPGGIYAAPTNRRMICGIQRQTRRGQDPSLQASKSLPPWGKVAPQGRMRGKLPGSSRLLITCGPGVPGPYEPADDLRHSEANAEGSRPLPTGLQKPSPLGEGGPAGPDEGETARQQPFAYNVRGQAPSQKQKPKKHQHGARHAGAYFLCQYQPNMLIRIPAATAEPITPATLGPMACMSR